MEVGISQQSIGQLDLNEKNLTHLDEKTTQPIVSSDDDTASLENGHLQELEVDLSLVILEEGLEDYDADHSPFPEVRAVVPEVDDQSIPVNTLRMWILGIVFTMIGCGFNQFFSMRYPSVTIVSLVAELLAYTLGVALAKTLPLYNINLGKLGEWRINPDRHFNIKEHTVIVIMSNVSFGNGSPDASSLIQAAKGFYGFDLKPGFSILIVLWCQLLGFGIAGLAAPLLVEPASIIWPGILSNCAVLSTLHSRGNTVANGWKISRMRYFIYVMLGSGVWYFFPGLMFVGLSYFTWVCWIAPKNILVNQVFGMVSGLGLSPITFDWSQIAYNTNPLLAPTWAAMNVLAGFVMFFWIVVPALYYSNVWYTGYLPIFSSTLFDNTASAYNVSKVLTNETFDAAKYAKYSPSFLPANFALRYGLSFATFTCVPVHILLWHYTQIKDGIMGRAKLDVHARLMRKYPKTPWYWFLAITLVMVALTIVMVTVYDTKLPWWAVLITTIFPALYIVPCGIIQGITNQDVNTLNVMAEFAAGYMFNGKPLANMIFKNLSVDVVSQGLYFVADMKLAHYMKIPPRTLFFAQGIAVVLGSLTQAGVTLWMLGNVKDICKTGQANGYTCPGGKTVFSSSIVWGAIGPARSYSIGTIYSGLLHFFWIGAIAPVVSWGVWKYWKKADGSSRDYLKWLNWPIIFIGTINIPPATGINYSSWAVTNIVFNWWIKKKYFAWWTKYNYILAAALDTGIAIAAIVIFFCITYPGAVFPDWWGNTVYANTADGWSVAWLKLPASGMFGPANGTWS